MYFPACSNLTSNYFNYSSFIRFFVIPNAGNNATVTWFAFIVVLTFYDLICLSYSRMISIYCIDKVSVFISIFYNSEDVI